MSDTYAVKMPRRPLHPLARCPTIEAMRVSYLGLSGFCLVAACGSATARSGGSHTSEASNYSGVEIAVNVYTGITTTSSPVPEQQRMSGLVRVRVDGQDAPAGTTLALNGWPIALDTGDTTSDFDVAPSNVPAVAPGRTITLEAHVGERSATFSFTCPNAVDVTTSPNPVVPGAAMTVSWKGNIYYDQPYSDTRLEICRYVSPTSPLAMSCKDFTPLTYPSLSVALTAPQYLATDLGYLVEM